MIKPPVERFGDNPFFVLGLAPSATRLEVERAAQRLQAMLELGLSSAEDYASPVGSRSRTLDQVRWALAELRDPERRLRHELWARLGAELQAVPATEDEAQDSAAAGFPEALATLGWRRRP